MIPVEALEVVGQTAPSFELTLRDGSSWKLDDQRGKIVVLAFWASWCGPCRNELPEMSALAAERSDVVFVAVNVDRHKAEAEKFLRQVQVTMPIAWDPDALALGEYNVMSMPTTFVIDKNGIVVKKKVGYSRERKLAELEAAIDGARR